MSLQISFSNKWNVPDKEQLHFWVFLIWYEEKVFTSGDILETAKNSYKKFQDI